MQKPFRSVWDSGKINCTSGIHCFLFSLVFSQIRYTAFLYSEKLVWWVHHNVVCGSKVMLKCSFFWVRVIFTHYEIFKVNFVWFKSFKFFFLLQEWSWTRRYAHTIQILSVKFVSYHKWPGGTVLSLSLICTKFKVQKNFKNSLIIH